MVLFINFSPVFNNKIMENRKFINEQHENTTTTFGYRHIKVITYSRIVFPECFQMHIIYPIIPYYSIHVLIQNFQDYVNNI